MSEPIVYVVPVIDTEGPTTGRDDMFDTWDSLGKAIRPLTTETRNRFRDSFGNPLRFSWFILDWTGYSSEDMEFKRRGHDNRLHAVWDFYRKDLLSDAAVEASGDGLYWHYHHPPKNGAWGWNDDWHDNAWHEYIIGKRMFDFGFFPAAYRAGKYVETNDTSQWLERWIPYDLSSIAPVKQVFCDWSRAPATWQPYHPSIDDYQHPGAMRRLIARSLPVAAKGGSGILQKEEVEKAFQEAQEHGKALFSVHTHDYYKSIQDDFSIACLMLDEASRASGIPWRVLNAREAMRQYQGPATGVFSLSLQRDGGQILISSSHALFGEMPFVVLENADGTVVRVDVPKEGDGWTLQVPSGVVRIAVGASDPWGNTDVKVITNDKL